MAALLMAVAGAVPSAGSAGLAEAASGASDRSSPREVCTFDARPLKRLDLTNATEARRAWDTLHLLAALQGLVNREAPRLYLFFCAEWGIETDRFWWDWFRCEAGWLKNTTVAELTDWESVVTRFRESFEGLVVYDGNVPATSNLASTAAGRERLLPVRWDADPGSLYRRLVDGLGLPVRLWLVGEDGASRFGGGSPKNAAYRWALDRWLLAGKAADGGSVVPGAFYLDAWWLKRPRAAGPEMHTLSNHDWFVSRGAGW